jgi:hypothetical protein
MSCLKLCKDSLWKVCSCISISTYLRSCFRRLPKDVLLSDRFLYLEMFLHSYMMWKYILLLVYTCTISYQQSFFFQVKVFSDLILLLSQLYRIISMSMLGRDIYYHNQVLISIVVIPVSLSLKPCATNLIQVLRVTTASSLYFLFYYQLLLC